jgi:hypothetical protein
MEATHILQSVSCDLSVIPTLFGFRAKGRAVYVKYAQNIPQPTDRRSRNKVVPMGLCILYLVLESVGSL